MKRPVGNQHRDEMHKVFGKRGSGKAGEAHPNVLSEKFSNEMAVVNQLILTVFVTG